MNADPAQRPWLRSYPPGLAWDTPLPPRSVNQLWEDAVERWPDLPFLHFFGRVQTYAEVARMVRAVAAGMRLHGVGPGSRVGLLLPNVPCFVVAGRHAIAGAQEPEVLERLLDVALVEA